MPRKVRACWQEEAARRREQVPGVVLLMRAEICCSDIWREQCVAVRVRSCEVRRNARLRCGVR